VLGDLAGPPSRVDFWQRDVPRNILKAIRRGWTLADLNVGGVDVSGPESLLPSPVRKRLIRSGVRAMMISPSYSAP
jgi:hypothetical protein